ncbi:hypothetical protein BJV82DRAFT_715133 [Fennellomyces sp. T-0311]|nr:hypothetical protein BJV82DRAFT_715133 [Fennellomyces sp. T-0311]
MYVSQVPATVIYTLLKTVLLIMYTKTIESICSWIGRYDVAKVMEQGSYTVLYSSIFTRNYRNFMTFFMILLLLFIIGIETVTNLLPTIATHFMPFHLVSFAGGDDTYFPAAYSTPMQPNRIPTINYSDSNPMQRYCEDMGLCTDGEYDANVLRISPTMEVTSIQYDYGSNRFNTSFLEVSTPYCLLNIPETPACIPDDMALGIYEDGWGPFNFSVRGISPMVLVNYAMAEESGSGAVTLSDAMQLKVNYRNETGDEVSRKINTWATLQMLYRPTRTDIISVTHLSSILYTNGRETVVLVLKAALHNLNSEGPRSSPNITNEDISNLFGGVFNNSEILYNATSLRPSEREHGIELENDHWMIISAFTHYVNDPYLTIDLVQRTEYDNSHSVLKARILFGVFVVTDTMLPRGAPRYYNEPYMTNYNSTRNEFRLTSPDTFTMRQPGFYDQMFDGFNDAPTKDLFMYAVLNSSDNTMFGTKGYQDVVADISPAFLGVLCGIILVMGAIFLTSRYTKDTLYFDSLYQTLGHIDDTGTVGDTSDYIPPMSTKDRKIFVGDKVLLVKDKLGPSGWSSDDDSNY